MKSEAHGECTAVCAGEWTNAGGRQQFRNVLGVLPYWLVAALNPEAGDCGASATGMVAITLSATWTGCWPPFVPVDWPVAARWPATDRSNLPFLQPALAWRYEPLEATSPLGLSRCRYLASPS
jgi:hypothetical protein